MEKIDSYLNQVGLSRNTSIGDAISKISGRGGARRSTRVRSHRCRVGCKHKSHRRQRRRYKSRGGRNLLPTRTIVNVPPPPADAKPVMQTFKYGIKVGI